jgi:hypothetical protein
MMSRTPASAKNSASFRVETVVGPCGLHHLPGDLDRFGRLEMRPQGHAMGRQPGAQASDVARHPLGIEYKARGFQYAKAQRSIALARRLKKGRLGHL